MTRVIPGTRLVTEDQVLDDAILVIEQGRVVGIRQGEVPPRGRGWLRTVRRVVGLAQACACPTISPVGCFEPPGGSIVIT